MITPLTFRWSATGNDSQQVALPQDEQFLSVHFDFCAGILGEQNRIAFLDVEWDAVPFVIPFARPDRHHGALLWFFLGRLGEHDPASRDLFLFQGFHDHTVAQGFERYRHTCLLYWMGNSVLINSDMRRS